MLVEAANFTSDLYLLDFSTAVGNANVPGFLRMFLRIGVNHSTTIQEENPSVILKVPKIPPLSQPNG